jgi:hypothetical protein
LYLDQVLPREYGIAKHPLFFIPYFNKTDDSRIVNESDMPLLGGDPIIENEDFDVAEQRRKIRQGMMLSFLLFSECYYFLGLCLR